MTDLTFRTATADDVAELVTLINSAYRGDSSRVGWTTEADLLDGQRTDPESLAAEIERPDTTVLLVEDGVIDDDPTPLGCCQLRREGDAVYLGMITVDPARQGGGVARAMIAEAERRAREVWGCTQARMTVIVQRTELVAYYGRLGYLPTGRREPFPYGDERFGIPQRDDLEFVELAKSL